MHKTKLIVIAGIILLVVGITGLAVQLVRSGNALPPETENTGAGLFDSINADDLRENANDLFKTKIEKYINIANYYSWGHYDMSSVTDEQKIALGLAENFTENTTSIPEERVESAMAEYFVNLPERHISIESPYITAVYENNRYKISGAPSVGAICYEIDIKDILVEADGDNCRIICAADLIFIHAVGEERVGESNITLSFDGIEYKILDYSQEIYGNTAEINPLLLEDAFWERVDGSTATIPMSYALYYRFLDSNKDASWIIYHNKTHEAYENLLAGNADIIFVTEPSAEARKLFNDAGMDIEVIPIVKDAFVLFVNADNPVKDLSQEQLKDIYTGKINNWKAVGGSDVGIIPYQRGSTSGSQTLFLSLLMRDTLPMPAPSEYYIADMGGIIDAVAQYRNGDASIGFSVFYYASVMYENQNIRLLEVDGVLPTEDSIISGAYPLDSYYYAVIRKDTPADHPVRSLVSYILGNEGQILMRNNGYVPLRKLTAQADNAEIHLGEYPVYWEYLYGIGAELGANNESMGVFTLPREIQQGVYYAHPNTESEAVNALLDAFIGETIAKEDFKARMGENLRDYEVPFREYTLPWENFLTCILYFGEQLYYHENEIAVYDYICIDTEQGAVVEPQAIIDALLQLEYMEGAKTVYEKALYSPPDGHILSAEHTIKSLWISSNQTLCIIVTDSDKDYLYVFATTFYGELAGG